MKDTNIQEIPLEQFIPHPANPNKMSKKTFTKLVANIKKTGLYEPVVVRQVGNKFQLINGHHRIEALKILGAATASAVVWEVDDATALTLLASLNRLNGTDILEKKSSLYAELLAKFSARELTKLLPASAVQLKRLASLKLPDMLTPAIVMPEAMVFFLNNEQQTIVQTALAKAKEECRKGVKSEKNEKSTAKMNAAALTLIAENYMQQKSER
jgi:ParB/RepB/Spo0J family partition protein